MYRSIKPLRRNNLKNNFLLYDTARYLFEILLEVKPGFAPASDNAIVPLDILREAYTECYKLEYEPIIMVSSKFNHQTGSTVYYSLQQPSLCTYSPKARNASTAITDLIELVGVVGKYKTDFSLPIRECKILS
ncbi:hypothetical protein clem_14330 [Legionella clemsonensis]|uniref:Uncharacterized protein n=1 Tax=Legionella clemsonensis TaxID=1867846 RepID=A0A222P6D4_9GAMM|nr:hypothetical protein clem_14330 [Legionella clemsonensis]